MNGPASDSARLKAPPQPTKIVPFGCTHGAGLLQPPSVVGSGSHGPSSDLETCIVEPPAASSHLALGGV